MEDRFWTRQVKTLEQQQQQRKNEGMVYTWDQMRTRCSCPPDTQIHIRAGFATWGSNWIAQQTVWFPNIDIDFTDTDQFITYTGNFTNAGYYMPLLLRYSVQYFDMLKGGDTEGEPPIDDFGSGSEYATSAAAEQAAQGWFDGATAIYDGKLPLCIVILKNNGTTGEAGQVLPVDAVNRGRSYFWRDVRPRNVCPYYE